MFCFPFYDTQLGTTWKTWIQGKARCMADTRVNKTTLNGPNFHLQIATELQTVMAKYHWAVKQSPSRCWRPARYCCMFGRIYRKSSIMSCSPTVKLWIQNSIFSTKTDWRNVTKNYSFALISLRFLVPSMLWMAHCVKKTFPSKNKIKQCWMKKVNFHFTIIIFRFFRKRSKIMPLECPVPSLGKCCYPKPLKVL